MRLWQKIFLLTLCLTVLAANSVALMLLVRNHANSLTLAKERLETICDGAVLEMGHLIQEKKEEEGCLLLTMGELEAMMSKARLDGNGQLFLADSEQGEEQQQEVSENEIIIRPVVPVSASYWEAAGMRGTWFCIMML